MINGSVRLIWKRSDPWAKRLGAPREIVCGEFHSGGEAGKAIEGAVEKLLSQCKTDVEREEIEHGSWWIEKI